MSGSVTEAVVAYNRNHAREWPESGAKCPTCGHGGCFGRLPSAPERWCCFSDSHGADSGGRGIEGSKVWHGDTLDVDAHVANLSRIDLLRREGYLDAPRAESKSATEHARNRDKLPQILVTPDVAHVVDQAEAVLIKSCRTLVYERGGVLVRVVRAGGRRIRGLRRPPRAPRAESLSDPSLFELLGRYAVWIKVDERGQKDVLPPGWVIKVLAARGHWALDTLEGIVEAPVLRPDGSVLDSPGYDEATGLIYAPLLDYPSVPSQPSRTDAERALQVLLEPFEEFPFVEDSDRAGVVASILTLVGRHAIDGPTPLFAMLSHTPGTGKGLLVITVTLIGTGNYPVTTTAFQEDEELRKLLTAVVLEGQRALLFDNAEGSFGSGVLAGALTAPTWSGRVLGVSRTVCAPLHTVMFVTGNNLAFVGDTPRRVVPVFVDAGIESPEEREFKRPNLLQFVRKRRPELLTAALTILRAFHVAGRPSHSMPLMGSYEEWDQLVRAGVLWLMGADPIAGRKRIRREGSAELEQMRALFRAIYQEFPEQNVTAAGLLKRAGREDALHTAIHAVGSIRATQKPGAQALGFALRRWCGRVAVGLRLERAGEARAGVLWRVVSVRRGDCGDCGDVQPRSECTDTADSASFDDDQAGGATSTEPEKPRELRNLRRSTTAGDREDSEEATEERRAIQEADDIHPEDGE